MNRETYCLLKQFMNENILDVIKNISQIFNININNSLIKEVEKILQANENRFIELLKDMKQAGIVPTKINEKEEWGRRYEDWAYRLQKSYEEAMQKEKLHEAFDFNRKMGKTVKMIQKFSQLQENSYLYYMGVFVGVFHAMSSMLIKRYEKLILEYSTN